MDAAPIGCMEAPIHEIGRTVRYAVGSNARTARLIALMLIVMIGWYVLL